MENEKKKLSNPIDMLRVSISYWWKNLGKFIEIYWEGIKYSLIPLAIILLLALLASSLNESNLSIYFYMVNVILLIIAFLFIFYFMTRAQIATFLYIKKDYQGKPKELFKDSKDLFWPYLGVSILTAVLILLWSLLLIIPGIIFAVFYSLSIYVFFSENKKGMEAIKRSKQLVSGYFWPVLGRIAFFFLVALIFSLIISIPAIPLSPESTGFAIWDAIVQIISLLIAPVYLIFFYIVYKDLAKIKK